MSDTPKPKVNRALLERLRMVDFLLDHFGYVKRKHLMDYFGISQPQASLDMQEYHRLAPNNAVYDLNARMYRRSGSFVRAIP